MKVHQIRIDFYVTSEVKRYVFVYLIEAKHCYLVDSGVAGCEDRICAKLEEIGRYVSDIRGNISDACASGSYWNCCVVSGKSRLQGLCGCRRKMMDRRH